MTHRRISTLACAAVLALGSPLGFAQLAALEQRPKPTLAPLMREVTPAVVNIAVVGSTPIAENPLLDDPFFRRFFDIPEQGEGIPQQSAGSGVIVDAVAGYVLTNRHVIANARLITVNLADRRELPAKLVGSDAGTDIALLQVDAKDLTALEFGDSDSLEVGDFVVAVGNPFGLGQTVTSGIVSALGRTGLGIEGYEDFIQTDAPINPGNSGGALVDLDGKLIGINAAIISASGGSVGIGFAVPSNMARAVMEQLRAYGEVRRGRLGIMAQDLTPDLATALKLPIDDGAIVTEIEPDSAAEKAGLAVGDVITALNGVKIDGSSELRNRIGLTRVGDTVAITAIRNGRTIELKARIDEPSAPPLALESTPSAGKLDGAQLRDLGPGHPRYGRIEGVWVTQVERYSAAWQNGLRPDDVILAVNQRAVGSAEELADVLRDATRPIALQILRGDARLFIVVR